MTTGGSVWAWLAIEPTQGPGPGDGALSGPSALPQRLNKQLVSPVQCLFRLPVGGGGAGRLPRLRLVGSGHWGNLDTLPLHLGKAALPTSGSRGRLPTLGSCSA